jgi:hypothetical protein
MLLDLHPAYNALWGAASATLPVQAASAVALSLDATGAGTLPAQASASAGLSLAAEVTGPTPVRAASSGTLALSGTASASLPIQATAPVSLTLACVAAGTLPVQSAATVSLGLGAVVVGRVPVSAAGAGGLAMAGTVSCRVPVACAAVGRWIETWLTVPVRTSLDVADPRASVVVARSPRTVDAERDERAVVVAREIRTPTLTPARRRMVPSMSFWKKTEDTETYQATLKVNGSAANLTTLGVASVELHLKPEAGGDRIDIAMTVTSASGGIVSAELESDIPAGKYRVSVVATLGSGAKKTWPDQGFETLTVEASL